MNILTICIFDPLDRGLCGGDITIAVGTHGKTTGIGSDLLPFPHDSANDIARLEALDGSRLLWPRTRETISAH